MLGQRFVPYFKAHQLPNGIGKFCAVVSIFIFQCADGFDFYFSRSPQAYVPGRDDGCSELEARSSNGVSLSRDDAGNAHVISLYRASLCAMPFVRLWLCHGDAI